MSPNTLSFSDLSAEIIPAVADSDSTQEKNGTGGTGSEGGTEIKDPASTQAAAEEAPDQAGKSSTANETAEDTDAESSRVQALPASISGNSENRVIGTVKYKFHDYDLGSVDVLFRNQYAAPADSEAENSSTGATTASADLTESGKRTGPETVHGIRSLVFGLVHTGAHGSIYLNILLLMPLLLAVTFLLCILIFVYDYFAQRSSRHRKKLRRAQRAQRQNASRYSESSGSDQSSGTSRYSGYSQSSLQRTRTNAKRRQRTDRRQQTERIQRTDRREHTEKRDYSGRKDYPERRSSGKRTPRDRSSR